MPKKKLPNLIKCPEHLAVILDGNGRWAKRQGLPRSQGHRAGAENLVNLLDTIIELKIPLVSLYAFSTENWKRPKIEVKTLWSLLDEFFINYLHRCQELNIKVRISGDLTALPQKSQEHITETVRQTAINNRLTVNFCINYGSQQEILHACNMLIKDRCTKYKQGKLRAAMQQVSYIEFEKYLYTSGLPAVDLLIRPGGEMRISNFLLWQCAYAQIYVTKTLWPDFDKQVLSDALLWFTDSHRRFGGL